MLQIDATGALRTIRSNFLCALFDSWLRFATALDYRRGALSNNPSLAFMALGGTKGLLP